MNKHPLSMVFKECHRQPVTIYNPYEVSRTGSFTALPRRQAVGIHAGSLTGAKAKEESAELQTPAQDLSTFSVPKAAK